MKKLIVSVALIFIAGCEAQSQKMTFQAELPDGFKDCVFARMMQSNGASYVIGRCPNSTTTVSQRQGKTTTSVITVDGVAYVPKEQ